MSIYPHLYQYYWRMVSWKNNNKAPYYLKQLRKSQFWSNEEIEKLQLKKLKNLISYAYKNVPYYKKILVEHQIHPLDITNLNDVQRLPILHKDIIRKNTDSLISTAGNKNDLQKDFTSGSTGEPLVLYRDKTYSEYAKADKYRSYEFSGYRQGNKLLYLWGAHRDEPNKSFTSTLEQKINRTLFVNTFDISEENMMQRINKIKGFHPEYILGYASSLYFFAKFFEKNNIYPIHPKSIISSAETLYDYQRKRISTSFHAPVFNNYGCREVGAIACECNQHNGLHVLAENQYLEIIGRDGESAAPGELGKIILTNLNNYSFPLIRYEIGDMAKKSTITHCNCHRGLPLLDEISGRTIDNFIFPNGEIIHGGYFIYIFLGIKSINHFQVIQEKINKLLIKIVKSDEFDEKEMQHILAKIKKELGQNIEIEIQYVEKIDKSPTGKHRVIVSKIIEEYYDLS
jgi:phenylacetate-CoA ligase